MSTNMMKVMESIFARLDLHYESQTQGQLRLRHAGCRRFVDSSVQQRTVAAKAVKLGEPRRVSGTIWAMQYRYQGQKILVLYGIEIGDLDVEFGEVLPLDESAPFKIRCINDLPEWGDVPVVNIRNTNDVGCLDHVEYGMYNGVDESAFFNLFRSMSVVAINAERELPLTSELLRVLSVALGEEGCFGLRPEWVGQSLLDECRLLAEVNWEPANFDELLSALLGNDPRSYFLAAYRLLEMTYGFEVTTTLVDSMRELGFSEESQQAVDWKRVYGVLAKKPTWRAKERTALELCFKETSYEDDIARRGLQEVFFGPVDEDDGEAGVNVKSVEKIAERVYLLRNSIVHGAVTPMWIGPEIDWSKVAVQLTALVASRLQRVARDEQQARVDHRNRIDLRVWEY